MHLGQENSVKSYIWNLSSASHHKLFIITASSYITVSYSLSLTEHILFLLQLYSSCCFSGRDSLPQSHLQTSPIVTHSQRHSQVSRSIWCELQIALEHRGFFSFLKQVSSVVVYTRASGTFIKTATAIDSTLCVCMQTLATQQFHLWTPKEASVSQDLGSSRSLWELSDLQKAESEDLQSLYCPVVSQHTTPPPVFNNLTIPSSFHTIPCTERGSISLMQRVEQEGCVHRNMHTPSTAHQTQPAITTKANCPSCRCQHCITVVFVLLLGGCF